MPFLPKTHQKNTKNCNQKTKENRTSFFFPGIKEVDNFPSKNSPSKNHPNQPSPKEATALPRARRGSDAAAAGGPAAAAPAVPPSLAVTGQLGSVMKDWENRG